jgi:hypothetical protein
VSFKLPPDERRCKALNTKGSRCKSWALLDDEDGFCIAHTKDASKKSLVMRDPARAQARAVAAKQRQRDDAEHRERLRSLSLREQVKARIEDRAAEIVDTLMDLAKSDDPQVALRAIDALWNRSYGRPVTPVVTADVTPANPMIEAFAQLSPDERRALLQQASRPVIEQAPRPGDRPASLGQGGIDAQ